MTAIRTTARPAPTLPLWTPVPPATLRFAAVTVLATFAALYVAYELRLESPYWAATSVLIVAQPVTGQVVGKGLYRAVGTVTGAVVGFVLIALFAQAPELFVAAMAGWIALCTYVSLLLRGFRAYGAVLAGYTAAIVAFGSVANPDGAFDIAVARGSAILLGVLSAALFSALLLPGRTRALIVTRLAAAVADTARLVSVTAAGGDGTPERRRLVTEVSAIEGLIEAAQAESLEVGRRLGNLRGALGGLLAALSALRSVEDHLRRLPPDRRAALLAWYEPTVVRDVAPALDLVVEDAGRLGDRPRSGPVLADPPTMPGSPGGAPDAVDGAILAGRTAETVRALAEATEGLAGFVGLLPLRPAPRPRLHRDAAQARRNALRAFLAVGASGAFWIATAWSAGGTFVTNVCVACSLFAAQPSPSGAALGFMRGASLAIAIAFAVKFFVLPWIDGFPLLVLATGPALFAGAIVLTLPGWVGTATAFNVIFLSNIAPTNIMSYDPTSYLDGAAATLSAFAVSAVIYRVVLPAGPADAVRRLLARMRREVRRAATARTAIDPGRTRSLMYDRLFRLAPLAGDADLRRGVAAMALATEVARLRAVALPAASRAVVEAALTELGRPEPDGARLSDLAADMARCYPTHGSVESDAVLAAAVSLRLVAGAVQDGDAGLAPPPDRSEPAP